MTAGGQSVTDGEGIAVSKVFYGREPDLAKMVT
jgi:hypothetical protein